MPLPGIPRLKQCSSCPGWDEPFPRWLSARGPRSLGGTRLPAGGLAQLQIAVLITVNLRWEGVVLWLGGVSPGCDGGQASTRCAACIGWSPGFGNGGQAEARLRRALNVRQRNLSGDEMIKQVFQEDKFEENVQDELENLEVWHQEAGRFIRLRSGPG